MYSMRNIVEPINEKEEKVDNMTFVDNDHKPKVDPVISLCQDCRANEHIIINQNTGDAANYTTYANVILNNMHKYNDDFAKNSGKIYNIFTSKDHSIKCKIKTLQNASYLTKNVVALACIDDIIVATYSAANRITNKIERILISKWNGENLISTSNNISYKDNIDMNRIKDTIYNSIHTINMNINDVYAAYAEPDKVNPQEIADMLFVLSYMETNGIAAVFNSEISEYIAKIIYNSPLLVNISNYCFDTKDTMYAYISGAIYEDMQMYLYTLNALVIAACNKMASNLDHFGVEARALRKIEFEQRELANKQRYAREDADF